MAPDAELVQREAGTRRHLPSADFGESGGPQGAELISELRRIEGSFIREPISNVPPPGGEPRGAGLVARAIGVLRAGLGGLGSGLRFLVAPGRSRSAEGADPQPFATEVRRSFEGELRSGLRVLLIGVGLIGGWAALVPLSAAVIVPGTLIVATNVKKIQHPTGGIVAEIYVHDGMLVNLGDMLVRLDDTQARSNLEVVSKQLDEVRMRIARLMAERDELSAPVFPPELSSRLADVDLQKLFSSEKSFFEARANARRSQKELLRGQIGQLKEQIAGLDAQIKSKAAQLTLITGELEGVQSLYDKHLVPLTRVSALQRESAQLEGERGQLVSTIAETQAKISGAELQIVRIDQDFRSEVTKDLRESQDKEAELAERSVAARDLLNRVNIRAPVSGVVHELAAHTVGGVISPAEVIMEIVPDQDELQIEARLQPNDIDRVRVGQKVLVRFSAFNQRTTPQITGLVSYVSADLAHDQQTHAAFYSVKAVLPQEEIARLGGLQLVSGMPAELFLETGKRTMMSYLLKPITDQLQRTFSQR